MLVFERDTSCGAHSLKILVLGKIFALRRTLFIRSLLQYVLKIYTGHIRYMENALPLRMLKIHGHLL